MANGDKVLSKGRCEELIKIQGLRFRTPFNVLTLRDCNIVLEVHCLKTVGPIWDFNFMSMSFVVG